ncbi:MAG: dihydropteroate synthase [Gemmatimonadota bacterium]|nr:dihydropteroate synthase [Gemmatimonadota bacterium]
MVPSATSWTLRTRVLVLDRPIVVGILNVTPDSFSDGGRYLAVEDAVAHARTLVEEGADMLDVGGESTRPQGATPVGEAEELRRVVPVLRALRAELPDLPLSVDTVKSAVAAAALAEGVEVINDVSGFRLDPGMAAVCAAERPGVILMHSRGTVRDMATYLHATYDGDVTGEVIAELEERIGAAVDGGVVRERIALDPGLGFAKRSEHSRRVLAQLDRLVAIGLPVMVGASRKRFVGESGGGSAQARRIPGTVAANVIALARGARLFRVHDVRPAREALDVAWAIEQRRAVTP